MKLETLKKSLELYLETTHDENERTEIINSISEIDRQIKQYRSRNIFNDTIHLITPSTITELLNLITYNEFGKLKKSTGSVSIEQYTGIINNCYLLDELTVDLIEHGYCFVNDLWRDNEHFGHNTPDGTIK